MSREQSASITNLVVGEEDRDNGGYSDTSIIILDSSEEEEKKEEEEEGEGESDGNDQISESAGLSSADDQESNESGSESESVGHSRHTSEFSDEEDYSSSGGINSGSEEDAGLFQSRPGVKVPAHEVIDIYSDSDQDDEEHVSPESYSGRNESLESDQQEGESEEWDNDTNEEGPSVTTLSRTSLEAENQDETDRYSESIEPSDDNLSRDSGDDMFPNVSAKLLQNLKEIKTESENLKHSNGSDSTNGEAEAVQMNSKLNATDIGEGQYSYNPNSTLFEASLLGSDMDNEGKEDRVGTQRRRTYLTEENGVVEHTLTDSKSGKDDAITANDETTYYSYNESTQLRISGNDMPFGDTFDAGTPHDETFSSPVHDGNPQAMDLNDSDENSSRHEPETDGQVSNYNIESDEIEEKDVEMEKAGERDDGHAMYVAAAREVLDQIDHALFEPVDDSIDTNSAFNGDDTLLRFVDLHSGRLAVENIKVDKDVSGLDIRIEEEQKGMTENVEGSRSCDADTPNEESKSYNEVGETLTKKEAGKNAPGDEGTQMEEESEHIGSDSSSPSSSVDSSIYYSLDEEIHSPTPDVHGSAITDSEMNSAGKKESLTGEEKYKLIISDSLYSSSNSTIGEETNEANEQTPNPRDYTSPFSTNPFEISLGSGHAQELLKATLSSLGVERDRDEFIQEQKQEPEAVPCRVFGGDKETGSPQVGKPTDDNNNTSQSPVSLSSTGNDGTNFLSGGTVELSDFRSGDNTTEPKIFQQPEHPPRMDENISAYVTAIDDSGVLSHNDSDFHDRIENNIDNSGYYISLNHAVENSEGAARCLGNEAKEDTTIKGEGTSVIPEEGIQSAADSDERNVHRTPEKVNGNIRRNSSPNVIAGITENRVVHQHSILEKLKSGISNFRGVANDFVQTIDAIDVESDDIETSHTSPLSEKVTQPSSTGLNINDINPLSHSDPVNDTQGASATQITTNIKSTNLNSPTNPSDDGAVRSRSNIVEHSSYTDDQAEKPIRQENTGFDAKSTTTEQSEQQIISDDKLGSDTHELVPESESDKLGGIPQSIQVDDNTELEDSEVGSVEVSESRKIPEAKVNITTSTTIGEQVVSKSKPGSTNQTTHLHIVPCSKGEQRDDLDTTTDGSFFTAIMHGEESAGDNSEQVVLPTSTDPHNVLINESLEEGQGRDPDNKKLHPISGDITDTENVDVYIDTGRSRSPSFTVSSSEVSLTEASTPVSKKPGSEIRKRYFRGSNDEAEYSTDSERTKIVEESEGGQATSGIGTSSEVKENVFADNSKFDESRDGRNKESHTSPESTKESIEMSYTETSLYEPEVAPHSGTTLQKKNKHKYRRKRKLRRPITSEPGHKPSKIPKRRGNTK